MKSGTAVLILLLVSCWSVSCGQALRCEDARVAGLVTQTIRNNTTKLIESLTADRDFASKMLREWLDYRMELSAVRTIKPEDAQGKCQCEAELRVASASANTTFPVRYTAQLNRRTDQIRVEVFCDQDALYRWALDSSGLAPAAK